jgi:hypothetical protein
MPFGSPSMSGVPSKVSASFGEVTSPGINYASDDNYTPTGISTSFSSSSLTVRMSCSSPGGRTVHSLSMTTSGSSSLWCIETHSLPLVGTVDNDYTGSNNKHDDEKSPSIIRTILPGKVCSALSRYPPIELLCVDVLSPSPNSASASAGGATPEYSSSRNTRNEREAVRHLPSLCVYTKKDVFLLDISYDATGAAEVEGVVSNVQEPYEDILMGNATVNILRIRQAPQKFNGYTTLCPARAMAMLTQYPSTSEYCLCLYHGSVGRSSSSSSTISMPTKEPTSHYFHMEDLSDPNEQMIDFCFCQSNGLSLLSSLTVGFLKASGEVLFATPIVFHGTVVPSQTVTKTLEFIDSSLKELDQSSATWKQYRGAKQFLIDAFPNTGREHFVTVENNTTTNNKPISDALNWPVKLQGPILLPPQFDNDGSEYSSFMPAGSIEPFGEAGELVGLAIGYLDEKVDFAVISPSSFIPRFTYESEEDSYELDNNLTIGHTVNHVDFSGNSGVNGVKDIKLIYDPMMDNVVHYLTPNQIISISTNTVKIASNKVRNHGSTNNLTGRGVFSPPSRRSDLRAKTIAWNCLDATSFQIKQNPIVGAVISGDVQLGHIMVVRFSDGNMVAINLTETRHLREMENFAGPEQVLAIQDGQSNSISEAEQLALSSLNETQALTDIVQPLIRDVIEGIGALAQVGGSATAQADVTPDVLAAVIGIQSKCKKGIFIPLMEIKEHVNARREELKEINKKQMLQLKVLKETIANLREKQVSIKEKTEIMVDNSKSLADRSASALQSSKDLLPTITQSEYDYFQELKRLDEKTQMWKSEVDRLSLNVSSINHSSAATPGTFSLSPDDLNNPRQLLTATGMMLEKYKTEFASAEENVDRLAAVAGFVRDDNY